jgi:hypothetical protein
MGIYIISQPRSLSLLWQPHTWRNQSPTPSDEVKQIIKDVEKEIEQDKQAQQDNETVEQNKNPKSETKEEKTILENGMLI